MKPGAFIIHIGAKRVAVGGHLIEHNAPAFARDRPARLSVFHMFALVASFNSR